MDRRRRKLQSLGRVSLQADILNSSPGVRSRVQQTAKLATVPALRAMVPSLRDSREGSQPTSYGTALVRAHPSRISTFAVDTLSGSAQLVAHSRILDGVTGSSKCQPPVALLQSLSVGT